MDVGWFLMDVVYFWVISVTDFSVTSTLEMYSDAKHDCNVLLNFECKFVMMNKCGITV